MAGKSGTQDWFYHAPKKRSSDDGPKDYPAPSQIPLLSNAIIDEPDRDDTGMMRGWIRDSDSKYIKLAKMRGRKDLLQCRELPPRSTEAQPYPRVDWFDHDSEDVQQNPRISDVRKVYLPDYMVHEEYNPDDAHDDELGDTRPPPRRPPYSLQDKLSIFQRDEDGSVNGNKAKLPAIKTSHKRTTKKGSAGKDKLQKPPVRQQKGPIKESQERPIMGKLLNFGYQHEWYEQRDKFQEHQKDALSKHPRWEHDAQQGDRLTTEYRDEINVKHPKCSTRGKQAAAGTKVEAGHPARMTGNHEEKEKELFKLSKFKKVASRINTHWSPEPKTSDLEKMDTYAQQLEETTHAQI